MSQCRKERRTSEGWSERRAEHKGTLLASVRQGEMAGKRTTFKSLTLVTENTSYFFFLIRKEN